eukprot:CAMPEP_0170560596 /NCGR_PEP_ID=MMETSP0211-20121228/49867_1 /TAXON_ID=311385 /ORGANISM="Pseudokeronopsis sp., Strain OXSARD2" /LENGTH=66 /DNA_ID=CAMNT_0010875005 /DNA_START=35 /DNA_END=231 /DNA_ORIENTATION=-
MSSRAQSYMMYMPKSSRTSTSFSSSLTWISSDLVKNEELFLVMCVFVVLLLSVKSSIVIFSSSASP